MNLGKSGAFRRAPVRPRIPVLDRANICPACDVVLDDGVARESCPECGHPVDWIDLRKPVWCCGKCDYFRNDELDTRSHPKCPRCDRGLTRVHALQRRDGPTLFESLRRFSVSPRYVSIGVVIATTPLLSLAADPSRRWVVLGLLGPLALLPVAIGGFALWMVGTSLGELRALARDRRTRVVHGLEHATAKVLEHEGIDIDGGLTTAASTFHLWIPRDTPLGQGRIAKAVARAREIIRGGHREIAWHPRCGTSALVALTLSSVFTVALGAIGLFAHASPGQISTALCVALVVLIFFARRLGLLAQRFLTVSTKFEDARVLRVVRGKEEKDGTVPWTVHLDVDL